MKSGNYLFFFILLSTLITLTNACQNPEHDLTKQNLVVKHLPSPSGDSCAEPFLFSDKSGTVYLSWVEKINDSATLKFSSFRNASWSAPVTIASGKNWFVNWADYPMIMSDSGKNFIAHYLEKSSVGKFSYDIKYLTSADIGRTWSNALKLHDDTANAEHGFVSIMPFGEYFFASWLDGRNTGSAKADADTTQNKHSTPHGDMSHGGSMSLRASVINGSEKRDDWELDHRVCDCCQTAVAETSNGPVVVYRDRSDKEIRDIAIVRYLKGEWQKPAIVFADNWQIDGCPVNGPRIAAMENNLAIIWFSAANNTPEVKLVFSDDGGAHFNVPIIISKGKTIGRTALVMLDPTTVMVSWMQDAEIWSMKVKADGTKGPPVKIAVSSASRSSGFPQMAKAGNDMFYAWTDAQTKRIRTAIIPSINKSAQ